MKNENGSSTSIATNDKYQYKYRQRHKLHQSR